VPVRLRGALATAAVLAVAGLCAGSVRAKVTSVTVGAVAVTRPLPPSFVGLAFTYSSLARWLSPTGPVDPVLVRLIRNLTPSGRPSLRIGGESADRSWWPIAGYPQPLGITYDLGPVWTEMAHRLAQATDAQLLLGLGLQADRPEIDKVEARELLRRVGRRYIQSLQIGNEPQLYAWIPWYKMLRGHPVVWYSSAGTPVYARPRSFGPSQFVAEVGRILRVIPNYPIAGPETNLPAWTQAFTRFLAPGGRVTTLTTHAYGVNSCVKNPRSDVYPSVPNLLSLRASRDLLRGMAPYISLAHRRGGRYRIDEMGAVTCVGRPGVSNSLATALWAVDALFDAARQGADGVNLHTDYAQVNQLFALGLSDGRWRATVQPIYYGALLFALADPAGSRLLSVHDGTTATLRVWASQGRDRRVRITLLNDSLRGSATVRLRLPAGVRSANGAIERLQAPGGAYATRGVTLAGRSFGTTTSGRLPRPHRQAVHARHGMLTVQLPKGSATLVTLGGPASHR
jgi:hypothetical protein